MQKILFIEDESALQRAMTEMLSHEGYRVLSALDGESGIRIAKEELPDLILLDLVLPKQDGFEVLESLRNNAAVQHIPVIVLSNLESGPDVQKALELGAHSYLVKTNYSLKEILAKVKECLESGHHR